MSTYGRVALVVVAACAFAVVAVVLLLVWHERGVEQQREAEVRRALPVVAAAVHAALEKDASNRITEALQRDEAADPDAYRQFIAIDRRDAVPDSPWGHDFSWRGKHYRWPDNPFTGRAMQAGTQPGDFSIRFTWYGYVSGSPDAFELTGYGADGKPVVTVSKSPSPVPIQP